MNEIIQAIMAQYLAPKQVEVDEMGQAANRQAGGMNQIQPQGQHLPGLDAMTQVTQAMGGEEEKKGIFGLGIGPF
jgi:hypothetical protein